MKRATPPAPLLTVFALIAFGIAIAKHLPIGIEKNALIYGAFSVGASILAILTAIFCRRKSTIVAFLFAIFSLVSFGAFRYAALSRIAPDDVCKLIGHETRLYGAICGEIELSGDRQRFEIAVDSVFVRDTTLSVSGKVRVYLYQANPLEFGDYIAIDAKLQEPRGATNPYAYDFKKSLESAGIRTIAFVYRDNNVRRIGRSEGNYFLTKLINPLRIHIEKTIDSNLHGDSAALLKGLLLGLGRKLPSEVRDAFTDSGTVHILAVSGLHVGIIAGLAWFVFASVFRIPRGVAALLTIALLAVFAGLVGGRPSVLRAGFMFSIIIIGASLSRPPNLLNSIGAAGAVLLAVKPIWIYDIGFQLSFGATLGIGYLMPILQGWLPGRLCRGDFLGKWIISPFIVSLSATLGTAPLVAWHFHRFQLIGPIANLAVLPPLGLIIGYGILGAIIQPISPFVASLFLSADWLLIRVYLLNIVKIFASLPYAYLTFPHPSIYWIYGYYAVLITAPIALMKTSKKTLAMMGYFTLFAIVLLLGRMTSVERLREDIRITFFDVGQGDCALVEFADGREMLIDGGPPGNITFSVLPYLQARGLEHIDAVVMTHSDADHVGGLRELQKEIEFGAIYIPYATYTSNLHRGFIAHAESVGTPVVLLSHGETIPEFPEFRVLWPDTTSVSSAGSLFVNPNEGSAVLMLDYGESQVLFTGDIGIPTENKIAEIADLECDIVKVPHHGSKYSSGAILIEKSTPMLSIISVGAKNRFGHPSERVIYEYSCAGSEVIRTDSCGAVIVTINRGKIAYRGYVCNSGEFASTAQPIPRD